MLICYFIKTVLLQMLLFQLQTKYRKYLTADFKKWFIIIIVTLYILVLMLNSVSLVDQIKKLNASFLVKNKKIQWYIMFLLEIYPLLI